MIRRFFQNRFVGGVICTVFLMVFIGGGTAWGGWPFITGVLATGILFNLAYRGRHGKWFDYD